MKNVFKTTEFWTTIVGTTISILILSGKLTPAQGTAVTETVTSVAGAILTLIATLGLVKNRSNVKLNVFHARCEMLHLKAHAEQSSGGLRASSSDLTSAIDAAAKDL